MRKIALFLAMSVSAMADAAGEIPAALQPSAGQQAFASVHAQGVQIYQCNLQQGQAVWEFIGPEAVLYDANGLAIGKHYAGPTWEAADGSRVVGNVIAKVDKLPGQAIPWLLLAVAGHEGTGAWTHSLAIQRIHTQGGLPPVSGCDGNHLGDEERVAYQADYVFFK